MERHADAIDAVTAVSSGSLPARVVQLIEAQRDRSEILIGWVQLGVLGLFSALFALSPDAYQQQPGIRPEPWFLGGYFLFTIARLWCAYHRHLQPWMLYLSSFLDIALLYGLIWTFHLKYEQPPSFYLKAPTLLYVFIFILLGSLSFVARYILFAGLCAVLGWLAMVGYVVLSDGSNPMTTRDYVEYLTSNSVLIGAEIDKIISIALVTGILAVAVQRARGVLESAVLQSEAASNLSRFVPGAVANHVFTAEDKIEPGDAETAVATVLFTDIEGFTAICEQLDPKRVVAALNEYFTVVSAPIVARGGTISQFQGDAILAVFNLPDADPYHARHAVEAATEIQQRVQGRRFGGPDGVPLPTRIGVTTGEVVGGYIGTSDRLHYTVHGDQVNLAARIEQLNKTLDTRVLVSSTTVAEIGVGHFPLEHVGEVGIRGHADDVDVYRLVTGP